MLRFGYDPMTEEHGPAALIENARRAEAAGFDFLSISDQLRNVDGFEAASDVEPHLAQIRRPLLAIEAAKAQSWKRPFIASCRARSLRFLSLVMHRARRH